jgi:Holliday junction DNA helicase RuvB
MGLDTSRRRQGGPAPGAFAEALLPDQAFDTTLRPRHLAEFVGQPEVVANLRLGIRAARERGEALDHVLLCGLPGLGKTTLAHIIATESEAHFVEAAAPTLQRPADLAGILTRLEKGDVLFIDEVHRLPSGVEEYLYAAMEDFVLDILVDQGNSAQSVRLELAPFTLVGATTREGLLTAPFRARFGIHERLEPYDVDDLVRIVHRSADVLGVTIDDDAVALLATRARGTPRIVNRFLKRVRDLAQVEAANHVTEAVAHEGLTRLGVDEHGLTRVDRMILVAIGRAGGNPVGVKTIAAAVGEEERTLEEVYEPHLLREGFLLKTRQGRRLTTRGADVAGVPPGDGELPL